ncbi:hypothetical protein DRP04_06355 [Archaeoglobales archaeon]|mgnify:CR=1 FL=1|nr:MAG: hypothetical protein DRP04_06355 [Archaeoglobales archaeon]
MSIEIKDKNNIPELLKSLPQERERILRLAGAFLEGKVKETIQQGRQDWPPLKPSTIKRKGSDKPLIDTGKLLNSITHKVEGNIAKVGVFGEYCIVAAVMEYGTTRAGRNRNVVIPARPYLRTSFDENKEEIERLIGSEVQAVIEKFIIRL